MSLRVNAAPSPNFDARLRAPDMIVLHYTGMPTGAAAMARLRDPVAKVSAHWLVEEDGSLFSLVDEADRAWHAGVSCWAGERDINGASIGVEIVNPGHEFGYRDFTEPQIGALIALLDDIRARWRVPNSRILAHSDVAPARKLDPGERFPWAGLAASGHGVWPQIQAAADRRTPRLGRENVAADLSAIGYDPALASATADATVTLVRAFQRHWAPHRSDGVADDDTRARIRAVRNAMAACAVGQDRGRR